jgi:hypothetical protein
LLGQASCYGRQDVLGGWFAHNRLIRLATCEVETTMAMSMVDPLDQWWRLGVKMFGIGRKNPSLVFISH